REGGLRVRGVADPGVNSPGAMSGGAQEDSWVGAFLQHLTTERGASVYTVRNYRQALAEFGQWFREQRQAAPGWAALERDDFRAYLRFLGRSQLSRAAI